MNAFAAFLALFVVAKVANANAPVLIAPSDNGQQPATPGEVLQSPVQGNALLDPATTPWFLLPPVTPVTDAPAAAPVVAPVVAPAVAPPVIVDLRESIIDADTVRVPPLPDAGGTPSLIVSLSPDGVPTYDEAPIAYQEYNYDNAGSGA